MSESIRFDNYELLRAPDGSPLELGRGAMGVTYKARDTDLHCDVALKIISPGLLASAEVRDRFLREARAAAQLRHPNIATVFRLGVTPDSTDYYAMEFCEGRTLQQALAEGGPLPASTAVHLAWQVSKALRVAEQHRLIHRDLKPANLIVTQPPDEGLVIKVIDFGLAKSIADGHESRASSAAGFAGTAHYASPEQIDELDLDIRSDIYSLGACLWFMLKGRPPFEGSVARVMSQTLSAEPPWGKLVGQPACVLALLRRMLAKNRDDRQPTAAALRVEMERCMESLAAEAGAEETPTVAAPAASTEALGEEANRTLGRACSDPAAFPTAAEFLETRNPAVDPTPASAAAPAPRPPDPILPPVPPPRRSLHSGAIFAGIALLLGVLGLAYYFGISAPRDRAREERASDRREEAAAVSSEGGKSSISESTADQSPASLAAAPVASEPLPAVPPPAPATPPPATPAPAGRILVNTIPPGATLRLDGRDQGKTPMRLDDVAEGIRRLSVQMEGYESAELIVEVNRGATSDPGTIHLIALKPTPLPPAPPTSPPSKFAALPPFGTPPKGGLTDDAVRALVTNQLSATVRGDNAALVACYASPVDFYDEGRLTSAALRRSFDSYRRTWPLYQIGELSEITIAPTSDPETKTAFFTYAFVARNPQNGKQSRGVAHDEITVRNVGGRAVITRCRQSVSDRQKNF